MKSSKGEPRQLHHCIDMMLNWPCCTQHLGFQCMRGVNNLIIHYPNIVSHTLITLVYTFSYQICFFLLLCTAFRFYNPPEFRRKILEPPPIAAECASAFSLI
jgi:hypothetical protein